MAILPYHGMVLEYQYGSIHVYVHVCIRTYVRTYLHELKYVRTYTCTMVVLEYHGSMVLSILPYQWYTCMYMCTYVPWYADYH
jgi:hypothetical protein